MNKLKIKFNIRKSPTKFWQSNGGFTLIEVVIVAGMMGLMGVYMMQMTSNMNKTMTKMDTRAAEQNLRYLTTLALTNKQACARTLGSFCVIKDSNPYRPPEDGVVYNESNCSGNDENGNPIEWIDAENNFELKSWPTFREFKLSNINSSNSTTIIHETDGSAVTRSTNIGRIFNGVYGTVFKSCNEFSVFDAISSDSSFQRMFLNDAYGAIPDLAPASCQEEDFYVDNHLMLTKFYLVNYPEAEGGVKVGTGRDQAGKVKFVFEFVRLKEKVNGQPKMRRESIDLYVQIDSNDEVVSCLSANDVEVFAADNTYILQNSDSANTGCNGLGGDMGATRSYGVSCADGDELVGYDPLLRSSSSNIVCDNWLRVSSSNGNVNTNNCTSTLCVDSQGNFDSDLPNCDQCTDFVYSGVCCRDYTPAGDPSFPQLAGVRVQCVKRFSN